MEKEQKRSFTPALRHAAAAFDAAQIIKYFHL
jgi:hypothetical protein